MPPLERYDRALPYSYAPGMFPSMEALKRKPERVKRLLVSERAEKSEGMVKLLSLCDQYRVRVEVADKRCKGYRARKTASRRRCSINGRMRF